MQDKQEKGFRSIYLVLHSMIHFVLIAALFPNPQEYWIFWVVVPISHYIIDGLKSMIHTKKNSKSIFVLDQALHLGVIALLAIQFTGYTWSKEVQFPPVLLTALAVSLSILTFVSSVVIRVVLSRWSTELKEESRSSVSLQSASKDSGKEGASLARAGMYIGILERFLVFLFIVLNQWAAIGLLITAKSVFRFSDLSTARNRKLTEYILLGTLLSFTIAILTGLFFLNLSKVVNGKMTGVC